jgi:DNA relaxase NicK
MANNSGVVMESQADWLTCSAHGTTSAGNLLDLARQLAKEEQARGNKKQRFRSMGYEGVHQGRVDYGQRDKQSTLLRLSGDAAEQHLTDALSVADEVTRFDIAVTWRADPPDPLLGQNSYALATYFHERNPRSALPHHHADADGGYNCQLGKRESENFFRLYNKEAECIATGDDPGVERYRACWRYELEVKGGLSKRLAETVEAQPNRPAYVQEYVYQYCQAHGIEPAFGQWGPRRLLPGFKRRSDRESKLRHLTRNVKPTVQWLTSQGDLEAVLDALGLRPDSETGA